MTYMRGTHKRNIWSKVGRKVLKILTFLFLNLLSARQPCPLQSLNSQTVRHLECCLMFRVWYAKELNIPLLIEKEIINPTNADKAFICHQRTDSSHAEWDSKLGLQRLSGSDRKFLYLLCSRETGKFFVRLLGKPPLCFFVKRWNNLHCHARYTSIEFKTKLWLIDAKLIFKWKVFSLWTIHSLEQPSISISIKLINSCKQKLKVLLMAMSVESTMVHRFPWPRHSFFPCILCS